MKMKQKSLRQLAREIGVSHSYLSQVKHGKRPASEKVVSKMVSSGKQSLAYVVDSTKEKTYNIPDAEVAQVVEQRTENPRVSGSTPLLGTNHEVAEQSQVSSRMPPCRREIIENV
jgi:transcriptional regulator with XRE-family HTH domain